MYEVADTLGGVVKTEFRFQGICTELVYTGYRRKETHEYVKKQSTY